MPSERASQGEQNGSNVNVAAPSSDELWALKVLVISTVMTTFTIRVHYPH